MRYGGGSEVKSGFYLKDWEIVTIQDSKGTLPGNADMKYVSLPTVLLIPVALFISFGYTLVFPVAGFVALFGALWERISQSRVAGAR